MQVNYHVKVREIDKVNDVGDLPFSIYIVHMIALQLALSLCLIEHVTHLIGLMRVWIVNKTCLKAVSDKESSHL